MSRDLQEPVPRRLRAALRAYPRDVRQAQGDVVVSLALDLVDGGGSSINRETLGLIRGGLVARAGALAYAPWEDALRRVGVVVAGALLAIVCGAAAVRLHELAWPGWSWVAVMLAPALALAGLLAGRRAPAALGAVLLLSLGVAQGNSRLPTAHLEGSIDWPTGGFALPLLACAIPGTLLLLAAAARVSRPASRRVALATLAWVVVGTILVRLVLGHDVGTGGGRFLTDGTVTIGDLRLNGLGLCMAAYGAATVVAMAVGVARRRHDPPGMLAGTLALATIGPLAPLYGFSWLHLVGGPYLNGTLLVAATVAIAVVLLQLIRLNPTTTP